MKQNFKKILTDLKNNVEQAFESMGTIIEKELTEERIDAYKNTMKEVLNKFKEELESEQKSENYILVSNSTKALNAINNGKSLYVKMTKESLEQSQYNKEHIDEYYEHVASLLSINIRHKQPVSCVILSEIANMPDHYVVLRKNGTVVLGVRLTGFFIDSEEGL